MADDMKVLLEEFRQRVASSVAYFDRDVEHRMYEQAALTSAQYGLQHLRTALTFRRSKYPGGGHLELLEHALSRVQAEGFHAEFGVASGTSLGFIARLIDQVIYGFDSFEGLPEDWSPTIRRGAFTLNGQLPNLTNIAFKNYRIVQGSFEESLPKFASQVTSPAAFLHLDCYFYSSSKAIFDVLGDRVQRGTVIVMRQYFNHPGWETQQFKAFQDFCARARRTYSYLSYTPLASSVALVID